MRPLAVGVGVGSSDEDSTGEEAFEVMEGVVDCAIEAVVDGEALSNLLGETVEVGVGEAGVAVVEYTIIC